MKNKGLIALSVTVVLVLLLNVTLWLLPSKAVSLDLSENHALAVSDQSKQFLEEMKTPVTLYVIRAGGNDVSFERFLERYGEVGEKLVLKWVELADSADLLVPLGYTVDQLKDFQYCILAQSQYRSEIVDYASLFYYQVKGTTLSSLGLSKISVAEYQSYAQYFSSNEQYATYLSALLNETDFCFQGESVLSQMIEYVSVEKIPVNYIAGGHGEVTLSGTVLEEIFVIGGIGYQTLDLTRVKEIPTDAATLLLMTPASDYSSEEISMIRRYLSAGGQVVLVTNEASLSMPNLMSLMASYGMTARAGAVKEWIAEKETKDTEDAATAENDQTLGPQQPQEKTISNDVEVLVNTNHEVTYLLEELTESLAPTIAGGNSIVLEDRVSLTPLFTTSERAFIGENTEDCSVHTLAAASETPDGARLVWFTGGDSFLLKSSEMSDTQNPKIANIYCLYFSLLWSEQGYESKLDLTKYADTVYETRYLQATQSQTVTFSVLSIVLIPIAVIGCGFAIRHRRKKRSAGSKL